MRARLLGAWGPEGPVRGQAGRRRMAQGKPAPAQAIPKDDLGRQKAWVSPSGWYTHEHRTVREPARHKVDQSLVKRISAILPESTTVVDMGCGYSAPYVHSLRAMGFDARGLDGTPKTNKASAGHADVQDLTGDCSHWFGMARWGLLLNVGEYVPEEYEEVLYDNVSLIPTEGLIVLWSDEAKRGTKNPKPAIELANAFGLRGYKLCGFEAKLLIFAKGV